jgi:hypothetical protein
MGGISNLANLHIEYNVANTLFTRNPIGVGTAGALGGGALNANV